MSRCSSCGAEIIWATTQRGKKMPLDPEPVEDGNVYLSDDGIARVFPSAFSAPEDVPLRKAHFATCPNAKEHRRG